MTFIPSIQSFVGSLTTQYDMQANVDWDTGLVLLAGDYATGRGVSKFDFLTGVESKVVDVTAILAGAYPLPMGSDFLDRLYMSSSNISNYNSFMQLSADLALIGQWGASSGGADYPNGLQFPTTWSCARKGNQAWMAGTTLFGHVVWLQSAQPFDWASDTGPTIMTDPTLISCPGMPNTGEVWILGGPELIGDPQELNLYKLTAPALPSNTPLFTINPTDVDPTAAKIALAGMICDQTDGNLIIKVVCSDAAVTPNYIVKVSVTDGSVLWAVPVYTIDNIPNATAYGRIRHGKYCHFCEATAAPTPATVFTIDTLTGAYTSYTDNLDGMGAGLVQCFDDTTGAIILQTHYTDTSGFPVPLNGTASFTDKWAALYVIESFQPPVVPGDVFSYARIWGNPP